MLNGRAFRSNSHVGVLPRMRGFKSSQGGVNNDEEPSEQTGDVLRAPFQSTKNNYIHI